MAKSPLKYDRDQYYPQVVKKYLGEKELRKEYSRLRSIARKRIERLQKSEFADSEILDRYSMDYFAPIKTLSDRDIRYRISDLARFLSSKLSTVTGQKNTRKKTLETLKRRGYKGITEKNYASFGRWMQFARAHAESRMFDSLRAYDIYHDTGGEESVEEMMDRFHKWENDMVKQRALAKRKRKNE